MAGKPLLLTAESEDKVALQAFQFTPLCWERHAMPESDVPDSPFQSTPPCAGGDIDNRGAVACQIISIHAPLCGGRQFFPAEFPARCQFQSTPPCAGGDQGVSGYCYIFSKFQSTPPCAGGDSLPLIMDEFQVISIHAPLCGGRPLHRNRRVAHDGISIHAPLCGGRQAVRSLTPEFLQFQSTPPCAGGDIAICSASF